MPTWDSLVGPGRRSAARTARARRTVWLVVGAAQANASVAHGASRPGARAPCNESVRRLLRTACVPRQGRSRSRRMPAISQADAFSSSDSSTPSTWYWSRRPRRAGRALELRRGGSGAAIAAPSHVTCMITNPAHRQRQFAASRARSSTTRSGRRSTRSVAYSTATDRGVDPSPERPATSRFASASCQRRRRRDSSRRAATYTLPEGTHTFKVAGVDLSGNVGAVRGTLASFRILDTTLVSGPANFSTVKKPTFTYSTLAGINLRVLPR